MAVRIREGHYSATKLDGVTFASAFWWPDPIHEGNGIAQVAIDEKATADQRAALLKIISGTEGGTFFEIFASVVSQAIDPIFVPIQLESDRERRVATLSVPGMGSFAPSRSAIR